MRINAFSDVCLRVLMVLCADPGAELLTTKDIAGAVGTPYNHVSKAVLKLGNLGLVDAVRGRAGGVRINAAGLTVTVGSVLRALDEREDVAECHAANGDCPLIGGCGLRGALGRAREAFYAELDPVAVSSLARPRRSGPVAVTLATRPAG
ncbi:RrF2 family transcriptional regulator [Pseudarthrobacter sp. P1]|uniref:RrF2 family transcriptional regulator n=1 Tax=Pseudarthrobacter sp. P1 TaxID=3418418 RepID=UPI003CEBC650